MQYKTNEDDTANITELLSAYELYQEVEKMKHCIRMYWNQCNLGKSVMFSLMTNAKKCLTIEINPIKKIGEVRVCINISPLTLEKENELVCGTPLV